MDNGIGEVSLLHILMIGLIFHILLSALSSLRSKGKKSTQFNMYSVLGGGCGSTSKDWGAEQGTATSIAAFCLHLFMNAYNTYLSSVLINILAALPETATDPRHVAWSSLTA